MEVLKRFLLKNWQVIIFLALSGLIVWPLFMPGYFSHHDDLQVMRIFEMRKCLTDLQIPCRWVSDMGYGNGYPLFNFYSIFPYYLGALFSYIFGYIVSAKILFFIPLVGGGIGMYFLAKELFGKIPGIASAILYLFAPYRALDIYVRGDVAESFAMAAAPFLLYFIFRLIKTGERKFFVLVTIFFVIFLLSHNIMVLIFSPVIFICSIYFLIDNKWNNWKKILLTLILSIGLSVFFLLPAYFEKSLVQTESLTSGDLNFRNQFVQVGEIFVRRYWGYDGSFPGSPTTISYQVGWPLWWMVVLAALPFIIHKKRRSFAAILFSVFFLSVFMMHNRSAPIWEFFKILAYVQFPWRFLSIAIFAASLLGAYFISFFKVKYLYLLGMLVCTITVILNWQYFRPEHFYYDMTDAKKLSGQNFIDQQKAALLDYLPKTALEPRELAPSMPIDVKGQPIVTNFINKSNRFSFNVAANQDSVIDVPVFDFPDWATYVDGRLENHKQSFPSGRIELSVTKGTHTVSGIFKNTPIRTISNLVSIGSLIIFLFLIKYGKNTKVFS